MNEDDADDLINNLISLSNGQIDLETFKQILIPNYIDNNGNSYFHFLTEYSFKEFCLRNFKLKKDQNIVSFEKYNEIKKEYNQQIIIFIQTLLELNCDLFLVNHNNQSPLILSIYKNNYIISKEYLKILQNLGIYTNEDYYDFLDIIIKNGNVFNKDCLELINFILSNIDEQNNVEGRINKLTTQLISFSKNFRKNIYEKYNETIKIVCLEYVYKDDSNNIKIKEDENAIQNIKKKSFGIINDYINKDFLSVFMKLIKLGANLKNNKESAFIYLMSYPFIQDLSNFIKENKIDLNFQDESGNTALTSLMNNKEYIIQISKEIYDNAFKCLINNININASNKYKKEKSLFYFCLSKDYLEEAKIIYNKFKNMHASYFNSYILNYFIEMGDYKKINEFLNKFKDEIDFNLFNVEHKKSLLHYICLYLSDDIHLKTFIQIFCAIDNFKIDYSLKDQFDRNFLFYLFLDENDNSKVNDPIQQLICIFQKYKFNNLNDKDIFGNNLLFYAVQSKASKCVDFLIDNGIIVSKEQNYNENSIFSICLLNKDFQLFNYLYDKILDTNIFNHKVYEPYKIKKNNSDDFDSDMNQKGETLYDFLNRNIIDKSDINMNSNYINNRINRINNYNNNIINNNNYNNIYNNNIFANNNYNSNNKTNNYNNMNNYNNINNINNYNNMNNYNIINNNNSINNYNNFNNNNISNYNNINNVNLFNLEMNNQSLNEAVI